MAPQTTLERSGDSSLGGELARVAAVLHRDTFPNGDRAALKRMGHRGPQPLALRRFMAHHLPHAPNRHLWRVLVCGIALQHGNPHAPRTPLGTALADISYSEMRLERLLVATDELCDTLVLRLARQLAQARATCDWLDIARLLATSGDARDQINERIARHYYRSNETNDP